VLKYIYYIIKDPLIGELICLSSLFYYNIIINTVVKYAYCGVYVYCIIKNTLTVS